MTTSIAVSALLVGALAAAPAAGAVASQPDVSAVSSVSTGVVKAANLANFQAGNIISDGVFFDRGTMTSGQIQSFLQTRVPSCQSGYVCLKDWYDTSRATTADAMCDAYPGGYRERASDIIYKVAQACGINPQVLLVTLQKEQGLVTHTWPSDWRYTIAMGQGCPDTAACDTRYYGFFNQVYGAARQFKRYANPPGTSQFFTWYAPGRTWNVLYHPNRDCGSSPVYIQNQATANLYYYTPYQPNGAALRAGYGLGDGCSAYGNRNFYNYFTDWFGSTQDNRNPFGSLDTFQTEPGVVHLAGWAADPDTRDPIEVHIYVGSSGTAILADGDRPDVGAVFPTVGSRHGFDVRVPASGTGVVQVCAFGINVGQGSNVPLACRSLTMMSGPPIGSFDSAEGVPGGIRVGGWTLDPDTAAPIEMHAYVDGVGYSFSARGSRPDLVAAGYTAYGPEHGFAETVPSSPGQHRVCTFGINTGPGDNVPLGCRTVMVPSGDGTVSPLGSFDALSVSGTTAAASGWAFDPDTSSPTDVRFEVGGRQWTVQANASRPDVGRAYPFAGSNRGFSSQFELPYGDSTVCVTAMNDSASGKNTPLGCRTVTIQAPAPVTSQAPIGALDSAAGVPNAIVMSGWTIDPDTTDPIAVHVYIDGVGYAYTADAARPDVAAAYPRFGQSHGFAVSVPATPGQHLACAFGIDTGGASNTVLGCATVTVP